MLIDENGDVHGLLSGGCLENDLAERATAAIRSGRTDWVTYDLRTDDDVFGLGVGCEGAMYLQLQPLQVDSAYEPLAGWLAQLEDVATVDVSFESGEGQGSVAFTLGRPHAVLLLGGGQDADPLVQFCRALGWRVMVTDHRPAYVTRMEQRTACDIRCCPVGDVGEQVNFERFDAAIVMSHHLASDRQYLCALAESPLGFVGLLGPPHRRDRLLDEIGDARKQLAGRLHSPVGKRIGGRGPAAIALEVAAELQQYFSGSDSD